MLRILLGKGVTSRLQFVSEHRNYNAMIMQLQLILYPSDIQCVTPTMSTDTSTGIAIMHTSSSECSGCVCPTAICMNDYSCTSMIKTVTVMPSCVLTEQVSSDTQTG